MRLSVRLRGALCAVLLSALLLWATGGVYAGSTSSSASVYLPLITDGVTAEAQVLALVNQQRHLAGCNVDLASSPTLNTAAYAHSRDMALNNFFSHTGFDGSTMVTRVIAAGYSFSMLAENLQAGARSPEEVVNGP